MLTLLRLIRYLFCNPQTDNGYTVYLNLEKQNEKPDSDIGVADVGFVVFESQETLTNLLKLGICQHYCFGNKTTLVLSQPKQNVFNISTGTVMYCSVILCNTLQMS